MKLWLLRPNNYEGNLGNTAWDPWFDKAFGFVIRAKTAQEARQLAQSRHGDEGKLAWVDEAQSICEELLPDGPAQVIIRDFASA